MEEVKKVYNRIIVYSCDNRNISTAISFALLSKASPFVISVAISFAAGAILVMLAESMMPEAFEEAGSKIGLAAMAGFAIAFIEARRRRMIITKMYKYTV